MEFIPINEKVLVEIIPEEETSNGLILPDDPKKRVLKAKVVHSGSDESSPLDTNDVILFNRYSGVNLRLNEMDYVLLEMKDIYGYFYDDSDLLQ